MSVFLTTYVYLTLYVYIYTYNIYNIYTKYTIYIYNLSSWFWNILSVIIFAEEKKYNIARSFHLFGDSKTFTKQSIHQEKLLRIHEKAKHGMEQQLQNCLDKGKNIINLFIKIEKGNERWDKMFFLYILKTLMKNFVDKLLSLLSNFYENWQCPYIEQRQFWEQI